MVSYIHMETATLAGGCFWCTEAIFKRLKGVVSATPGYTGGTIPNPTYDAVCSGKTGHAESVQIVFDPAIISYRQLLEVFFHLHDPTTLNQQGNDTGTQYRSSVFYHSEAQKEAAEAVKKEIDVSHMYEAPAVTEIVPYTVFYPAEDYHKAYYEKNSFQPYCQFVIDPKISKLMKEYRELIKDEEKRV